MMNKPISKKQSFFIISVAIIVVAYTISTIDNQSSNTAVPTTNTTTSTVPNDQQSEIDALKKEVDELKNKPQTSQAITEAPQEIPKSSDGDYSAIIAEWQDRVAMVICDWNYSNGTTYQTSQASGLLANYNTLGTALITNKHAIIDSDNNYGASVCRIGVYGKGSRLIGIAGNNSPVLIRDDIDLAIIKLASEHSLPDDPVNTDAGIFDQIASRPLRVCKSQVNIGDKLIILGYPAIGSQSGITATEGIVSGFDGDYYITSAKIDHGNSGGLAILLKDDCYLGIPTWVLNLGGFESLGRILKSSYAFGN